MAKKHNLPRYISLPNWNAFVVKFARNGNRYYKSFSFSEFKSTDEALGAAVAWRDRVLNELQGGDPEGVRRSTYEKKGISYIRFVVSIQDDGKSSKTKTFTAGSASKIGEADIEHAKNTALAFRLEWEFCKEKGTPFDDEKYIGWQKKRLYPFVGQCIEE